MNARIPRRLTLVVFSLCLISYDRIVAAADVSSSLQLRLLRALEYAREITNIEIQYDDFLWIKGKPISAAESNEWSRTMKTGYPFSGDYSRTMHVNYIAAEGKYRFECRCESPQSTNVLKSQEIAFDGKLWSEFKGDYGSMAQQDGDNSNDLENPLNPLIQPFLFLWRYSDDCHPCAFRFVDLRSPDVLNGLVLPDAQSSNGMLNVSFPGLPLYGVNQLWNITIDDADPGFMPRNISRISYAGGKAPFDLQMTFTLSDYTNIGGYQFPTKLLYSNFLVPTNKLLPTTIESTGVVTIVSVKIPSQIPDSTFRLDESKAARIWNTGENKGYGVGLLLGETGSNIVVKRIVADSPAGRQSDIHVGDRILSIAESNKPAVAVHAGKANLPRVIAMLQGTKGSAVRVTFVPSGQEDSQTQAVTLVRGEVRGRLNGGRPLVNGKKAPDIEMVALQNGTIEHLADYAGKIVVLEFWASWCSPCQKSMADLQLDAAHFPNWKDKVVLIAASVDDTAEIAAKRVNAKGWFQTHNVWLKAKDLHAYPVEGIPTAYVIDAKGTITDAGVAGEKSLNIPDVVNKQLEIAERAAKKN